MGGKRPAPLCRSWAFVAVLVGVIVVVVVVVIATVIAAAAVPIALLLALFFFILHIKSDVVVKNVIALEIIIGTGNTFWRGT